MVAGLVGLLAASVQLRSGICRILHRWWNSHCSNGLHSETGDIDLRPAPAIGDGQVSVIGDTAAEPDEAFEVRLSNPVCAVIGDGIGIGTIANDETIPPTTTPPPPAQRTLTVSKTGDGLGRVTSQPIDIDRPGDCTEPYANGTAVTLNLYPGSGSTFTGWSGACSGTAPCALTMDADRSVTANLTESQPLTQEANSTDSSIAVARRARTP